MAEENTLIFFVNGKRITESSPQPEWTLLYYLRYKLGLPGTKEGCSEGGCGACTVLMSTLDRESKLIMNKSINACLTPLCAVHLSAIITTEGLGSLRTGLHPVQERIAKSHGSQCGFCTPGFVMSMYALLRNNPEPSEEDLETAFQGNLCRCTGYRPILQGYKSFCKPSGCCRENGSATNGCCMNGNERKEIAQSIHDPSEFKPYEPTQDPIFPPELQLLLKRRAHSSTGLTSFPGENVTWYRPSSLEDLLELKAKNPTSKIVGGNTELGVDYKYKKQRFRHLIHVTEDVPELLKVDILENGVNFGAGVTLSEFQTKCKKFASTYKLEGLVFAAIAEILQWFGGQQIRNVATIGGNIATASPISDLNPIFIASGSTATLVSKARGTRVVKIDQTFFTSYRKTIIEPDEVLTQIFVPKTKPNEYFWAAKQARRKDDDIAIVNSAIRVSIDPTHGNCVKEAIIAFGGMGPTTVTSKQAVAHILKKELTKELTDEVVVLLQEEFYLPQDVPGGMAEYRTALTANFFFKFFLQYLNWTSPGKLGKEDHSGVRDCFRPAEIEASQLYQIVPSNQPVEDIVGRPVVHVSGLKHATGEAIYVDDMPLVEGELHGSFVLSNRAVGKILRIDVVKAMQLPGVVHFFSASDIPKGKRFGPIIKDEPVFADDFVECHSQPVGFIVATSQAIADQASSLVEVIYDDTDPPATPILSIEDAIEKSSYFDTLYIESGNIKEKMESPKLEKLRGTVRMGGQEHFYMETQSCISYPKEDEEVEVVIASQSPTIVQGAISYSLGIPAHKVVVKVRRMGGGFGGKETRAALLAIATSLAAKKLRRPVRCILNRVDDMKLTGFRHPFLCNYEVAYEKQGKIHGINVEMYANAGISLDLSKAVMVRAVMTIDAGYNIPAWGIKGYVCKTNLPSNTAFRGFGGPQASFIAETILDEVAAAINRDPYEIRTMHLYKDGDVTPYDLKLEDCTIKNCWDECANTAEFVSRKKSVDEFNRTNRWKKRGLSLLPTKHLIGFTESFLNQAGALVMIYVDGSVSLNHGGTEMGQGLHTKMIQIASRVLGIPSEKIYMSESSTDKVPNTSSTAGSLSSDLNGPAVINACNVLMERLKTYREANPKGKWEDWVKAAYFDRVSLAATGYHTLNVGFDLETKKGIPCSYITYGVGCSEVEIDVLTGDHTVLRTDIVMDLGESLNPAIDIGQIEGGFVQGYGLFTLEELLFSPNGSLLTKGPGMYKIPSVRDIPKRFNVSLLRGGTRNPRAVYSSKAVGEPPLFLGASVFFAIKDAIRACRMDRKLVPKFRLDSPATAERIVLACQNTESSPTPNGSIDQSSHKNGVKPWAINV